MIFISYRRSDTYDFALSLAHHLRARYGDDAVFFDKDSLRVGSVYPPEIERALGGARVVLVLIGDAWEGIGAGLDGIPRLMEPEDWVRRELEQALAEDDPTAPFVVPILRRRRAPLSELSPNWRAFGAWPAFKPVLDRLKARTHADFRDDAIEGPAFEALCRSMEAEVPLLRERAGRGSDAGSSVGIAARIDSPTPADDELLRAYLDALVSETTYLKQPRGVGQNDRAFMIHRDSLRTEVPLLVPKRRLSEAAEATAQSVQAPQASLQPIMGERGGSAAVEYERALLSAWLLPGRFLVIAAGPGSGKSSLLQGHAYAMARAALADPDAPFPLFIPCRDVAAGQLPGRFDARDFLRLGLRRLGPEGAGCEWLLARFLGALAQGQATLLIDGLDELESGEQRRSLCRALVTLVRLHPQAVVVLTSRPFDLEAARNELAEELVTEATVAPLDAATKKAFIQAWAPHFGWREGAVADLEAAVAREGTARLTENVLMLSLIAQLHQADRQGLPRRRVDVLRRALVLMIERQRPLGQPAVLRNEVLPQLEYLALHMVDRPNALISDREACRLFRELRDIEPDEADLTLHTPEALLRACVEALGILVIAERVEDRGRLREHLQFFHPSFCEYLAAAAMSHGLAARGDDPARRLADHLAARAVVVTQSSSPRDDATDHVVEDEGFERVKLELASADAAMADRIVRGLLGRAVEVPAWRSARLAYVLLLLEDEPHVSSPVLTDLLQAAFGCLREADGFPRRQETALYRALATLLRTRFAEPMMRALALGVMHGRGEDRRHRTNVLAELAYRQDACKPPEAVADTLSWLEPQLGAADPLDALAPLMALEIDFEIRCVRWRSAPRDDVAAVIDLLAAALGRSPVLDFAVVAALNALTVPWGERQWELLDDSQVHLGPDAAARLEALLRQHVDDDTTFARGARLLSRQSGVTSLWEQQDWFLLAAYRADGVWHHELENRTAPARPDRWAWMLERLTPTISPYAADVLSLTLVTDHLFSERSLARLCDIALNSPYWDFRSQAIVGLAMSRAPCAAPTLNALLDREDTPDDGEVLGDDTLRALFGLILLDDPVVLAARAAQDARAAVRQACERALALRHSVLTGPAPDPGG